MFACLNDVNMVLLISALCKVLAGAGMLLTCTFVRRGLADYSLPQQGFWQEPKRLHVGCKA